MITDARLKDLIRSLIIQSPLGAEFKDGKLYHVYTYEPNMSKGKEYLVISILESLNAQIQPSVVNVNIYVPDSDNASGAKVQSVSRIRNLSDVANSVFSEGVATGEYWLKLEKMPIFKVQDFDQHAINCRIKIKSKTF